MSGEGSPGSIKGIVRALRLTSVGSLLTIGFGVGTNKIIAVFAGPTGVALIGVYRLLMSIVTSAVQLGISDLAVQRISTARSRQEVLDAIGASSAFLIVQSAVTLTLALVCARPLATLLLGADGAAHISELRLVLATTVGVLALQTVTALLNGQLRVAESTRVAIFTSAATLATVYPLVRMGPLGLALVLGGTGFLGAALGGYYIVRDNKLGLADLLFAGRWRTLFVALPISLPLIVEPLVVTGSGLAVQALVTRHYGIDQLGYFNAASLLEGTAVMVLTASMRSYYLPTLGRFTEPADKERFVNRMLMLLTVAVLVGVLLIVGLGPLAIRILFSARFLPAAALVSVLAVSIVGQLYNWCYAMFLTHHADYKTRLWLETVWAAIRVGGTWYCVARGLPILDVAWVYVAAYAFSGALHAVVSARRYGWGLLRPANIAGGLGGLALLVAIVLYSTR